MRLFILLYYNNQNQILMIQEKSYINCKEDIQKKDNQYLKQNQMIHIEWDHYVRQEIQVLKNNLQNLY